MLKKSISILLSAALVWTSGSVAQATSIASEMFAGPSSLPQFQLQPPGQLGRIADYFNAAEDPVGAGLVPARNSRHNPYGPRAGTRPAPTRPLVILIQDLHAHYGVQKNIAGLLEFLAQKLSVGAGLVPARKDNARNSLNRNSSNSRAGTRPAPTIPFALAVEGASGPIDSSIMALFPDEKVKLAAADYLMREGELTGAEFFAIQRGLPDLLVGAENEKYYTVNRDLFRKTLADRQELVATLKTLQSDFNALPRHVFRKNPALWEFHQRMEAHDKGEISTHEFIRMLMDHVGAGLVPARKSNSSGSDSVASQNMSLRAGTRPAPTIDLKRDFPALASFAANSHFGTMDQVHAATADFLTQVQGQLSPEEKSDLKLLAKNRGTTTYYLYLRELVYKKQLFVAVPPELAQYMEYIHTAQTMGMDRVAHEAKELAFRIKLQLAAGPAVTAGPRRNGSNPAVDLVQVQHDLDLLLRLSDLQATEFEVRDFAPRLNQFIALARALTADKARTTVTANTAEAAKTTDSADKPGTTAVSAGTAVGTETAFAASPAISDLRLRRLISSSIDFYVMALVRNRPMIENTIKLITTGRAKTTGAANTPEAAKRAERAITSGRRHTTKFRSAGTASPAVIAEPAVGAASASIATPAVAVLVAGGFHTVQMTHLLRQKNVSYLVITPTIENVTDADHDLYVKRLSGDHLTVEQVLADARPNDPVAFRSQLARLKSLLDRNDGKSLNTGLRWAGSAAIFFVALFAAAAHGATLDPAHLHSFTAAYPVWAKLASVVAALGTLAATVIGPSGPRSLGSPVAVTPSKPAQPAPETGRRATPARVASDSVSPTMQTWAAMAREVLDPNAQSDPSAMWQALKTKELYERAKRVARDHGYELIPVDDGINGSAPFRLLEMSQAARPPAPLTFFLTRLFGRWAFLGRLQKIERRLERARRMSPEVQLKLEMERKLLRGETLSSELRNQTIGTPFEHLTDQDLIQRVWIQEYFAPRFEKIFFVCDMVAQVFAWLHGGNAPQRQTRSAGASAISGAFLSTFWQVMNEATRDAASTVGFLGLMSNPGVTWYALRQAFAANEEVHRAYNAAHRFDQMELTGSLGPRRDLAHPGSVLTLSGPAGATGGIIGRLRGWLGRLVARPEPFIAAVSPTLEGLAFPAADPNVERNRALAEQVLVALRAHQDARQVAEAVLDPGLTHGPPTTPLEILGGLAEPPDHISGLLRQLGADRRIDWTEFSPERVRELIQRYSDILRLDSVRSRVELPPLGTNNIVTGEQIQALFAHDPINLLDGKLPELIAPTLFNTQHFQILPELVVRQNIDLGNLKPLKIKKLDQRTPVDKSFGFELEFMITDQLGMKRGERVPEAQWPGVRARVISQLQAVVDRLNADLDRRGVNPDNRWNIEEGGQNLLELKTAVLENNKADWDRFRAALTELRTTLPGGFFSMHMHAGQGIDREHLNIDSGRFARLVKVFEAEWRVLANLGFRKASDGYVRMLGASAVHKAGSANDHGGFINLNYHHPTIEFKLMTGLLNGNRQLDIEALETQVGWAFDLLDAVTPAEESMPLAILGIPAIAGEKPSQAQIDHFIDLIFQKDPVEAARVRELFAAHANDEPGLSPSEIEAKQEEIRQAFEAVGLGVIFDLHARHEGYFAGIIDHLKDLNNKTADQTDALLDRLAKDLIQAGQTPDQALGFFPSEIHEELLAAMDRVRTAKTAVPSIKKIAQEFEGLLLPASRDSINLHDTATHRPTDVNQYREWADRVRGLMDAAERQRNTQMNTLLDAMERQDASRTRVLNLNQVVNRARTWADQEMSIIRRIPGRVVGAMPKKTPYGFLGLMAGAVGASIALLLLNAGQISVHDFWNLIGQFALGALLYVWGAANYRGLLQRIRAGNPLRLLIENPSPERAMELIGRFFGPDRLKGLDVQIVNQMVEMDAYTFETQVLSGMPLNRDQYLDILAQFDSGYFFDAEKGIVYVHRGSGEGLPGQERFINNALYDGPGRRLFLLAGAASNPDFELGLVLAHEMGKMDFFEGIRQGGPFQSQVAEFIGNLYELAYLLGYPFGLRPTGLRPVARWVGRAVDGLVWILLGAARLNGIFSPSHNPLPTKAMIDEALAALERKPVNNTASPAPAGTSFAFERFMAELRERAANPRTNNAPAEGQTARNRFQFSDLGIPAILAVPAAFILMTAVPRLREFALPFVVAVGGLLALGFLLWAVAQIIEGLGFDLLSLDQIVQKLQQAREGIPNPQGWRGWFNLFAGVVLALIFLAPAGSPEHLFHALRSWVQQRMPSTSMTISSPVATSVESLSPEQAIEQVGRRDGAPIADRINRAPLPEELKGRAARCLLQSPERWSPAQVDGLLQLLADPRVAENPAALNLISRFADKPGMADLVARAAENDDMAKGMFGELAANAALVDQNLLNYQVELVRLGQAFHGQDNGVVAEVDGFVRDADGHLKAIEAKDLALPHGVYEPVHQWLVGLKGQMEEKFRRLRRLLRHPGEFQVDPSELPDAEDLVFAVRNIARDDHERQFIQDELNKFVGVLNERITTVYSQSGTKPRDVHIRARIVFFDAENPFDAEQNLSPGDQAALNQVREQIQQAGRKIDLDQQAGERALRGDIARQLRDGAGAGALVEYILRQVGRRLSEARQRIQDLLSRHLETLRERLKPIRDMRNIEDRVNAAGDAVRDLEGTQNKPSANPNSLIYRLVRLVFPGWSARHPKWAGILGILGVLPEMWGLLHLPLLVGFLPALAILIVAAAAHPIMKHFENGGTWRTLLSWQNLRQTLIHLAVFALYLALFIPGLSIVAYGVLAFAAMAWHFGYDFHQISRDTGLRQAVEDTIGSRLPGQGPPSASPQTVTGDEAATPSRSPEEILADIRTDVSLYLMAENADQERTALDWLRENGQQLELSGSAIETLVEDLVRLKSERAQSQTPKSEAQIKKEVVEKARLLADARPPDEKLRAAYKTRMQTRVGTDSASELDPFTLDKPTMAKEHKFVSDVKETLVKSFDIPEHLARRIRSADVRFYRDQVLIRLYPDDPEHFEKPITAFSTAIWNEFTPVQRAALLGHELAHLWLEEARRTALAMNAGADILIAVDQDIEIRANAAGALVARAMLSEGSLMGHESEIYQLEDRAVEIAAKYGVDLMTADDNIHPLYFHGRVQAYAFAHGSLDNVRDIILNRPWPIVPFWGISDIQLPATSLRTGLPAEGSAPDADRPGTGRPGDKSGPGDRRGPGNAAFGDAGFEDADGQPLVENMFGGLDDVQILDALQNEGWKEGIVKILDRELDRMELPGMEDRVRRVFYENNSLNRSGKQALRDLLHETEFFFLNQPNGIFRNRNKFSGALHGFGGRNRPSIYFPVMDARNRASHFSDKELAVIAIHELIHLYLRRNLANHPELNLTENEIHEAAIVFHRTIARQLLGAMTAVDAKFEEIRRVQKDELPIEPAVPEDQSRPTAGTDQGEHSPALIHYETSDILIIPSAWWMKIPWVRELYQTVQMKADPAWRSLRRQVRSEIREPREEWMLTVYYPGPGIGTDFRAVLDFSNARRIVGVDVFQNEANVPMYSPEIKKLVSARLKEMGVRRAWFDATEIKLKIQRKENTTRRYEFKFIYRGEIHSLVLYQGDANSLTPDCLPETHSGFEQIVGKDFSFASSDIANSVLNSLSRGGLAISGADGWHGLYSQRTDMTAMTHNHLGELNVFRKAGADPEPAAGSGSVPRGRVGWHLRSPSLDAQQIRDRLTRVIDIGDALIDMDHLQPEVDQLYIDLKAADPELLATIIVNEHLMQSPNYHQASPNSTRELIAHLNPSTRALILERWVESTQRAGLNNAQRDEMGARMEFLAGGINPYSDEEARAYAAMLLHIAHEPRSAASVQPILNKALAENDGVLFQAFLNYLNGATELPIVEMILAGFRQAPPLRSIEHTGLRVSIIQRLASLYSRHDLLGQSICDTVRSIAVLNNAADQGAVVDFYKTTLYPTFHKAFLDIDRERSRPGFPEDLDSDLKALHDHLQQDLNVWITLLGDMAVRHVQSKGNQATAKAWNLLVEQLQDPATNVHVKAAIGTQITRLAKEGSRDIFHWLAQLLVPSMTNGLSIDLDLAYNCGAASILLCMIMHPWNSAKHFLRSPANAIWRPWAFWRGMVIIQALRSGKEHPDVGYLLLLKYNSDIGVLSEVMTNDQVSPDARILALNLFSANKEAKDNVTLINECVNALAKPTEGYLRRTTGDDDRIRAVRNSPFLADQVMAVRTTALWIVSHHYLPLVPADASMVEMLQQFNDTRFIGYQNNAGLTWGSRDRHQFIGGKLLDGLKHPAGFLDAFESHEVFHAVLIYGLKYENRGINRDLHELHADRHMKWMSTLIGFDLSDMENFIADERRMRVKLGPELEDEHTRGRDADRRMDIYFADHGLPNDSGRWLRATAQVYQHPITHSLTGDTQLSMIVEAYKNDHSSPDDLIHPDTESGGISKGKMGWLNWLRQKGEPGTKARAAAGIAADLVEFAMLFGLWAASFYFFGHDHPLLTAAVGMVMIPSFMAWAHSWGKNAMVEVIDENGNPTPIPFSFKDHFLPLFIAFAAFSVPLITACGAYVSMVGLLPIIIIPFLIIASHIFHVVSWNQWLVFLPGFRGTTPRATMDAAGHQGHEDQYQAVAEEAVRVLRANPDYKVTAAEINTFENEVGRNVISQNPANRAIFYAIRVAGTRTEPHAVAAPGTPGFFEALRRIAQIMHKISTKLAPEPEPLAHVTPREHRESDQPAVNRLTLFLNAVRKGQYQKGRIVDFRKLPKDKDIIVVGDLHARGDHLRRILNANDNLGKLHRGEAVLLLLGDIIHSEDPSQAAEMGDSVEAMQLLMDLKIQNPDSVYMVLGNHDFLNNGIVKGEERVRQDLLYHQKLMDDFGPDYVRLYEAFIESSPLMAIGDGFVAIHAGPVANATLQDIQNAEVRDIPAAQQSRILLEATWGRLGKTAEERAQYDQAYSPEDVVSFMARMGQPGGQLIVGHSPHLITNGSFHQELLPNHHVLFSAGERTGYAALRNGLPLVSFHEATQESTQVTLGNRRRVPHRTKIGAGAPSPLMEATFEGSAWIHAGSYAYKIWLKDQTGHVQVQQHEGNAIKPTGAPTMEFSLGEGIPLGRLDPSLGGQNAVFQVKRGTDGSLQLRVRDMGSASGTTVVWSQPTPETGAEFGPHGSQISGTASFGRNGHREIVESNLPTDPRAQAWIEKYIDDAGIRGRAGLLSGGKRGNVLESVFAAVKRDVPYKMDHWDAFAGLVVKIGETIDEGGECRHMGILSALVLEHLIEQGYLHGQVYYVRGRNHGWAVYRSSTEGKYYVFDAAQRSAESPGPAEGISGLILMDDPRAQYWTGSGLAYYKDSFPFAIAESIPLASVLDPTVMFSMNRPETPEDRPASASERVSEPEAKVSLERRWGDWKQILAAEKGQILLSDLSQIDDSMLLSRDIAQSAYERCNVLAAKESKEVRHTLAEWKIDYERAHHVTIWQTFPGNLLHQQMTKEEADAILRGARQMLRAGISENPQDAPLHAAARPPHQSPDPHAPALTARYLKKDTPFDEPLGGPMAWITAGSFAYRLDVKGMQITVLRHHADKTPIANEKKYEFFVGESITVGTDTDATIAVTDAATAPMHFVASVVHKDKLGSLILHVADLGSLFGTKVEYSSQGKHADRPGQGPEEQQTDYFKSPVAGIAAAPVGPQLFDVSLVIAAGISAAAAFYSTVLRSNQVLQSVVRAAQGHELLAAFVVLALACAAIYFWALNPRRRTYAHKMSAEANETTVASILRWLAKHGWMTHRFEAPRIQTLHLAIEGELEAAQAGGAPQMDSSVLGMTPNPDVDRERVGLFHRVTPAIEFLRQA